MKCEFSLTHYEECLELLKGRDDVILTHDIDLSPQYALELAKLEHKHGISTTYYILLHSEWYNALSPASIEIFKELVSLGHQIGIHYDTRYFSWSEMEIIRQIAGTGGYAWSASQHLPTLTPSIKLDDCGLTKERKEFWGKFISDSGGRWREGCMCNHIGKEPLVICAHPIWWVRPTDTLWKLQGDAFKQVVEARELWERRLFEHALSK